jgi:hypothetical protein
MGIRNQCSKRKVKKGNDNDDIRKRSTTKKNLQRQRRNDNERKKCFPGKSMLWHDIRSISTNQIIRLHAMWWLIRLENPPIILTKSFIENAQYGIISSPFYKCTIPNICIPFDNVRKVQNSSIDLQNSPWSIKINKNESWIPNHIKPYNLRGKRRLYASAGYVNHPLPSNTPDDKAFTIWGQDLRKANCKIVSTGKYPYIVPTTTNGIIPPGHELLANYRGCKSFKYKMIYQNDMTYHLDTFGNLRYQNLIGDPAGLSRHNNISRPGIVLQSEARTLDLEGQNIYINDLSTTFPPPTAEVPDYPDVMDEKVMKKWRAKHPFTNIMKKKVEQFENYIDYEVLNFYNKNDMINYAGNDIDWDLFNN